MKFFLLISSLILVTVSKEKCGHKSRDNMTATSRCYKGKLEIKAACMNYTISMIGNDFDTSLVVGNWTDESTGKSYKNVFALNSRCTFPGTINQGDEFYFKIDTTTVQNCFVCLIYYPVPSKKLSIKVIPGPCP